MTDPVRLNVNYDADLDWLMALEFGRVDDGQHPDQWVGLNEQFGFLLDAPEGRIIGFRIHDFSTFEPDALREVWEPPYFHAPVLGLLNAPAGVIATAAASHFQGRSSFARQAFQDASSLKGEDAVEAWTACLEAGDSMAHYGLGYTLLELGHAQEAYGHLRHYTEISPHGPWAWCYYGRAAAELGETSEARRAYRRAIELTEAGGEETDAPELLAALEGDLARDASADAMPISVAPMTLALWGNELPDLGRRRVDVLSTRAAVGLTAGAKSKACAHTDPNEDVVAVVARDDVTLLVCADGHNGATSSHVAVETVVAWFADAPDPVSDNLVDVFASANDAVLRAGPAAGQSESRTTLIVALVGQGTAHWAAMGDSMLITVTDGRGVEFHTRRESLFVGWPMTRDELISRMQRGTIGLDGETWLVAATDGYSDFVPSVETFAPLAIGPDATPATVATAMLDQACHHGAGDNVAVGVVRGEAAADAISNTRDERIRGCLIGGAVGDALGAPIEFLKSWEVIEQRFGPDGITGYEPAYGRRGAITDDTQMTLFTAEGLIRGVLRWREKGIGPALAATVDHAYARWLATQGEASRRWKREEFDGWLIAEPGLHARRAPGNTCLSALRASREGTIDAPINDSKGCGAVMRAAPAGFFNPESGIDPFSLGCELGALTHGHPSGYLAAGALASLVSRQLWNDERLEDSLAVVLRELAERPGHEEVVGALDRARLLALVAEEPGPAVIAQIGEGWVAEEALAIAVYCCLVATDFREGVLLAVNHAGDTDSTGAIAGNLLGVMFGVGDVPGEWVDELELGSVIAEVAQDAVTLFVDGRDPVGDDGEWWDRYPGW